MPRCPNVVNCPPAIRHDTSRRQIETDLGITGSPKKFGALGAMYAASIIGTKNMILSHEVDMCSLKQRLGCTLESVILKIIFSTRQSGSIFECKEFFWFQKKMQLVVFCFLVLSTGPGSNAASHVSSSASVLGVNAASHVSSSASAGEMCAHEHKLSFCAVWWMCVRLALNV